VPLIVFHVWHFPAVSTVQPHPVLQVLLHSNSVKIKCLIYVATTAQWIQQIIKCGLYRAFLSYKVSDVLNIDVLGG